MKAINPFGVYLLLSLTQRIYLSNGIITINSPFWDIYSFWSDTITSSLIYILHPNNN